MGMPACAPADKGGQTNTPPDKPATAAVPKVGEVIPAWEEGVMDIHFINSTTGESVFVIMPDGTQLLIDAASSTVATNSNANTTNTGIRSRWDPTKTNTRGSQIIADYIRKCMVWTGNDRIDYFVTTHYDNDHIGGYTTSLPFSSNSNTYRVIGAAEILDEFKIGKFMDRGYPDYNYPHATKYYKDNVQNYIKAVKWHVANKGLNAEIFKSGSNTQIAPKTDNNPTFNGWGKAKPNYEIDYIYVSGFGGVKEYKVVNKRYADAPFISDHYPIMSVITF